tara:strand:+ start:1604 stop:2284 length:681 start_codon:yes stop_codon:yes gene_type:complete
MALWQSTRWTPAAGVSSDPFTSLNYEDAAVNDPGGMLDAVNSDLPTNLVVLNPVSGDQTGEDGLEFVWDLGADWATKDGARVRLLIAGLPVNPDNGNIAVWVGFFTAADPVTSGGYIGAIARTSANAKKYRDILRYSAASGLQNAPDNHEYIDLEVRFTDTTMSEAIATHKFADGSSISGTESPDAVGALVNLYVVVAFDRSGGAPVGDLSFTMNKPKYKYLSNTE